MTIISRKDVGGGEIFIAGLCESQEAKPTKASMAAQGKAFIWADKSMLIEADTTKVFVYYKNDDTWRKFGGVE